MGEALITRRGGGSDNKPRAADSFIRATSQTSITADVSDYSKYSICQHSDKELDTVIVYLNHPVILHNYDEHAEMRYVDYWNNEFIYDLYLRKDGAYVQLCIKSTTRKVTTSAYVDVIFK